MRHSGKAMMIGGTFSGVAGLVFLISGDAVAGGIWLLICSVSYGFSMLLDAFNHGMVEANELVRKAMAKDDV